MATVIELQRKVRGTVNQLRLIGGLLVVSLISNLVLVTLVKMSPGMVLVPTLRFDTYMGGPQPSEAYVEALTRDVIQLYLNRHPNNSAYFRENVLRVVDPQRQGEFQAALDEAQKGVQSQASTTFFPQDIYMKASENYSEVGGFLDTYIGTQKVQSAPKRYALRWVRRGYGLFLDSISEITPEASKAAKMPFTETTGGPPK